MDARERYAEVHAEYRKMMYNIFITDIDTYNKVEVAVMNLANAAFDFGAEEAKKTWQPNSIHEVF